MPRVHTGPTILLALALSIAAVPEARAQGWEAWVGRTQSWGKPRYGGCPDSSACQENLGYEAVRTSPAVGARLPLRVTGPIRFLVGVGLSERGWSPQARRVPTLFLTVPISVEVASRLAPTSRLGFSWGAGVAADIPVDHNDLYASFLMRGGLRWYQPSGRYWELGVERTQSANGVRRFEMLSSTTVFFAIPVGPSPSR